MKYTFLLLTALLASSCSQTPGDAFRRSNDDSTAAKMYHTMAQQGDVQAAFKLGLLLSERRLSPAEASHYGPASRWFAQSCPALPAACHNLGVEYTNAGDHQRAEQFYLTAATRNYMQSQFNLASAYVNGYLPLPADPSQAFAWLLIARQEAARCQEAAPSLCQWVLTDKAGNQAWFRSRLTPAQQAEAERRAATWAARH